MIREIVAVKTKNIIYSNSRLKMDTVKEIENNFSFKKYAFPTGYINKDGVILTDGNHRVKALERRGDKFIYFCPLTKKEFDYVKFSNRSVNVNVHLPEKVQLVNYNNGSKEIRKTCKA